MPNLYYSIALAAPAHKVFYWHTTPDALQQLIPPWEQVRVVSVTGEVPKNGAEVVMEMKLLGVVPLYWVARHEAYIEGQQFVDIQTRGPFTSWQHVHRVEVIDDNSCNLIDEITYQLPLGWVGEMVAGWFVRQKINRMFMYRHQVMREIFGVA